MNERIENESALLQLLLESGKAITSEVELEKLVQKVTDIGTELSGAHFGALFYNVENPGKESYLLYTISGVPKEAFSKFPHPRNTKIFEPTFSGRGIVRYDDVTQAEGFGQNAPHFGMPRGHLPVRSYLAAPVISPVTKEVIGGLFFGHPDAGVFTKTSERLVEGIAAQAAIALGNARLFEQKKFAEKSLREQKEQYSSIFNSTSDAIIIFDEGGRIAEVNPAASRLYGYSYPEMIGLPGTDLMPESPEQFEGIRNIVASGRRFTGSGSHARRDGTLLIVEMTGTQFLFKGTPHFLAVIRDRTSDLQTEEALRKSEEFAQIITNVSPVILWMTNSAGETIYINRTWGEWVGQPEDQQLGRGWLQPILPEDREGAQHAFLTAFSEKKIFNADFRITRHDGQIRWCATYGTPYYNSDGSFGGFAGSLIDITDRKKAEEKLESQNILINTITNNTLQALFLMDDRQYCTYMNPAAEKMTGYRLHEVQEKPLHDYVHHTHPDGRHFPIEECAIDRALPTRSQTQGEEVFIHRDGHFYPVAFIASPIIENGIPKGTVIEVRETTEEKRMEEALRRKETEAKELLEQKVRERTTELEQTNYELMQFTSVASHDLKEPLRKISIFGKLLGDKTADVLDASSQKYLQTIIQSSQRMTRLIDDLLTFSRLTQTDLPFEPVVLNSLLDQITEDLELVIRDKNAVLERGPLPVIDGVPLQLGQVFQNLLSNALKFAHPGRTPRVRIYSEVVEAENRCRIFFEDNGIGFNEEYSGRIFDVFVRLHTKEKFEGTGVGLAIVKKIVSLHRGQIRVHSREDEGTTFIIELPLRQPQPAALS